ncbi:serine hydrolase [Lactiplantibacillus daowaiensis]|uniref:Serine hydrolase n=1 Tax=Lactiplantibacillus daowaiensis TaxID=2559918 RepID=A0ABW1RZY8_9LACO|nr:serine hydrolase [Lactiplantibacillus daowaiensis]
MRFKRQRRLRRGARWVIGVAIVCVVGGGGLWWWNNTLSHASQTVKPKVTKTAVSTKPTKKVTKPKVVPLKTRLERQWQTTTAATKSKVAVAVYDPSTKHTYQYSNRTATTTYVGASTVKVGILVQLLHQRDQGVLSLSANDEAEATQMIEQSDNDAADFLLFHRLGGSAALTSLYQSLGMTHSHAAPVYWGLTTTIATDQLQLLKVIFTPNHYLSKASRAYAQKLMNNIATDQAWGVSKGAASYQLKNGWLDADDNGHWAVNSVGRVVEKTGKQGYLMSIYTNNNTDEASGITLVNKIAQATNRELAK